MTSPAVTQAAVARRWSRLHPQLAPAIARALALVGGVSRVTEDVYEVEGVGQTYYVEINRSRRTSRCSCPAWQHSRDRRCKHTIAVALVVTCDESNSQPNETT